MSSMSSMAEALEFFAGQIGNPEPQKGEFALAMAEAEAWAEREGVTFEWQDDWEVDHVREFDCYEDGGPETCEMVTAYLNGEIVASLACVDDASDDYRRFVEAELVQEAMSEVTR